MDVELSEAESAGLRDALRSYLSSLAGEISATDDRRYRDDLKAQRAVLEGIEAKLADAGEQSDLRDSDGRAVVRLIALWWSDQ